MPLVARLDSWRLAMTCVINVTQEIQQHIDKVLSLGGFGVTLEQLQYEAQCDLASGRDGKLLDCGDGFFQYSFSMISVHVTLRLRVIPGSATWTANIIDCSCSPSGPLAF